MGVQAAGMMPDGPIEKSIYGYVKDNSGTPIYQAKVYNPTLGTRYTDANGAYYYLNVNYGTYVIQASKSGYWTEKANTTITYPQMVKRQDFQLPNDVVTSYEPLISLFSTVDTDKADTHLYAEASSGVEAEVYAYATGSGLDYTVYLSTSISFETWDHPSLIVVKKTKVTGWFWATQSGDCMNAYVTAQYNVYDASNEAVDSLDPGSVDLEEFRLSPGINAEISVLQTGSAAVQEGIAMSIEVGILGTGFSYDFEAGLRITSTQNVEVGIEFENTDTTSRSFYYYKEGNIVLHLWDEDNI
ncbi:MAG: carboxypeptidase-like regulatory domain-containing protein [Candidatus Thorarchaeota archaeon]